MWIQKHEWEADHSVLRLLQISQQHIESQLELWVDSMVFFYSDVSLGSSPNLERAPAVVGFGVQAVQGSSLKGLNARSA